MGKCCHAQDSKINPGFSTDVCINYILFFWRYLEFHRVTKMLDHIFSTKPVEDPGYYRNNIQNIVPYLDTDKLSATVLELSVPKSH